MELRVENFSAWHGQAQVLWDLEIVVPSGTVVGVLGRNGAGKTTLLRAISGLHRKSSGGVRLGNREIARLPAHEIALAGVALVREAGQVPRSLSVTQNLALGQRLAASRGKTARSLADAWRWFPLLEPLADRKAELLSGGQRQALALATAFVSRPDFLLLDEPSAGLAPSVARALYDTIKNLVNEGITAVVVEQHPAWLADLVNRCYLLENGRVTDEGPLADLVRRKQAEIL